jgi:hypothetical protein
MLASTTVASGGASLGARAMLVASPDDDTGWLQARGVVFCQTTWIKTAAHVFNRMLTVAEHCFILYIIMFIFGSLE